MIEPILTFLVFVGTLMFVVQPLIQHTLSKTEEFEDTTLRNLEQEKFNLYAQIKEIDFEYEMGKLSYRDYSYQRDELMSKASNVVEEMRKHKERKNDPAYDIETSSQETTSECSACGTRVNAGAKYCFSCGAALPESCRECGESNPPESKFCASCGTGLVTA